MERGVKKADEVEEDCRAKKNKGAEDRREREWDQLERIARLFRAPQPGWTRTDVLTLGELVSSPWIRSITYHIHSSHSLSSLRSNGIRRR